MTLIVDRLMNLVVVPVGINLLRNDAKGAWAIASCVNAQLIRVNGLNGIMATDQGLIEGNAHELLRFRRELGSDIAIFADVWLKFWVPEGRLAGIFRDGFRPIFGQTWPQNPSRTTGLVLQCRLHQKSAPQTNSKAISWQFVILKSPPPMNR